MKVIENVKDHIRLIEDHHEAYYLWQGEGFKNKTLVHLDAHIDFGFHDVKPPQQIFKEARTKTDLKIGLERLILFKKFQFSEKELTNIGNYIYPAIRDGVVNKFYWVIPGSGSEFRKSIKTLKGILGGFIRMDPYKNTKIETGRYSINATIYNIPFCVVTLDSLPEIKEDVLLDIDVDFLTTPSLKLANPTSQIGEREPWISPPTLLNVIKDKIRPHVFTTVSYSVNGGFTPMKYKFLGDEIRLRLKNGISGESDSILTKRRSARSISEWQALKAAIDNYDGFEAGFKNKFLADILFNAFMKRPTREFYNGAVRLNPLYKARDNNYGPLFLAKRKTGDAGKEFKKILNVDRNNIFARVGLGNIYLQERKFHRAIKEFKKALKGKRDFNEAIFGLAAAEFRLKNYDEAKRLFLKYETIEKPNADTRYYLGRIYERKNLPGDALEAYKNALQLGKGDIGIILKILKILKENHDEDTLKLITKRYKEIKSATHSSAKIKSRGKRFKITRRIKRQIESAGKMLKELIC